jgi:Mn-dependent DtxR family transcriptional regulator
MGTPGREPTVSDEDILEVFQEAKDPVLTTREVAETIDIGHRGTYDRLKRLAEDDLIVQKKVGDSGAVWWYPDALRKQYSSD